MPCRRWRSHSCALAEKWQGVAFPWLSKNGWHWQGGGNGGRKWEQKKGRGVLRWAREVKWVFDSSTTRRLAFEINVQHMWRPVKKNQEEECWEGATKHPFRPRSDTASLPGLFWPSSLFRNKARWFIWKEDGKHSLTAIKVRADLRWSWSRP